GDAEGARLLDLRVFGLNRARVHDHVGAVDVVRAVPEVDTHPEATQVAGVLAVAQVGAGDVELEGAEDLRQTAHADPPDPDEMHLPTSPTEHHVISSGCWPLPPCSRGEPAPGVLDVARPARSRKSRAMVSAAWGRPSRRAAAAMRGRVAGSSSIPSSVAVRRSTVAASARRQTAAPPCWSASAFTHWWSPAANG